MRKVFFVTIMLLTLVGFAQNKVKIFIKDECLDSLILLDCEINDIVDTYLPNENGFYNLKPNTEYFITFF